jgi:UbiA prenyltransferase family
VTAETSATEEAARPGSAKAVPRHARGPAWPVAVLRTARPRQWPRNLLVFAAPLAGATWRRPHGALYALVAGAAFLFASVAVYFINDVVDAERDRRHPRKRFRPMAAGDLPKSHAIIIGAVTAAVGLSAGIAVKVPWLTAAVGAYLAISFLYSDPVGPARIRHRPDDRGHGDRSAGHHSGGGRPGHRRCAAPRSGHRLGPNRPRRPRPSSETRPPAALATCRPLSQRGKIQQL